LLRDIVAGKQRKLQPRSAVYPFTWRDITAVISVAN
jgi:hypothetical protein